MIHTIRLARSVIYVMLLMLTLAVPFAEAEQTITIAAANSLKDVLRAVIPAFEKEHPTVQVRLIWGPSQTLRDQIAQGAPIDVFLPSSLEEIEQLEKKMLTLPGTK